jgi:hypothetical protein
MAMVRITIAAAALEPPRTGMSRVVRVVTTVWRAPMATASGGNEYMKLPLVGMSVTDDEMGRVAVIACAR